MKKQKNIVKNFNKKNKKTIKMKKVNLKKIFRTMQKIEKSHMIFRF